MVTFRTWLRNLVRKPYTPPAEVFPPIPIAPATPFRSGAALLTARDRSRLSGVHPDLVRVVERARASASFIVVEGLRSRERQVELVQKGASKTMNSRHLTGHAVDLAPTINGEVRWDWPLFYPLAEAVKAAAKAEGVNVEWGGDWTSFKDGPHWQLRWSEYP